MTLPTIVIRDFPDRRRRPRLMLTYPVRLFRAGDGLCIHARTENISCQGFFCITEAVFSLRDKLQCELVIPSDADGQVTDERANQRLVLHCVAEVVRIVKQRGSSLFGIGCRLSDYTIERESVEQDLALEALSGVAAPLAFHAASA